MVLKYFCFGIQVHVFTSINIWLLIGIMSHLHSDLWNSSGIGNEQLIKFHVGIDDKVMFIYIQVHFTTFLNLGGFVFQEPHQLPSCLLPLTPPNPNLQVTRSLEEKQDVYFVLNPIAWTSCIESNNLDKTVLCWYQGNSGLYFLRLLVRDVTDLKKFVTFFNETIMR